MSSIRPPKRRRAGIVCVECHARKIKCNLQERPHEPCYNCNRNQQMCQRRRNNRSHHKTHIATPQSIPRPSSTAGFCDSAGGSTSQSPMLPDAEIRGECRAASANATTQNFLGFLGDQCMFSPSDLPEWSNSVPPDTMPRDTMENVLQVTRASVLPSPVMIKALAEMYFEHLFPHLPVLDRCDVVLQQPSMLLMQSLCMAGSHFRPHKEHSGIPSSEHFYNNAKMLLHVNHEKDSLVILKSLCLIASRSSQVPTQISLDGTWHWIGIAVRYAINMGLHKESTYTGKRSAGSCRRIWWHLFNSDKLQSAGYGRPPAIPFNHFDTELPTLEDFSVPHPDNEVFVAKTKLCTILGSITAAQCQYRSPNLTTLSDERNIINHLKEWVRELPEGLRLYEGDIRRPYRRPALELHLIYFTCIILVTRFREQLNSSWASLKTSLVASSIITCLFEEILYRGEIDYMLPINNWFCMVGSIPLLLSITAFPDKKDLYTEKIDILKLVLRQMATKTPSSDLMLGNIRRIQNAKKFVGQHMRTPSPRGTNHPAGGIDQIAGDVGTTIQEHFEDLFPFPSTLCESMDLLRNENSLNLDQDCSFPIQTPDDFSNWMFDLNYDILQVDSFPATFEGSDISVMGLH